MQVRHTTKREGALIERSLTLYGLGPGVARDNNITSTI